MYSFFAVSGKTAVSGGMSICHRWAESYIRKNRGARVLIAKARAGEQKAVVIFEYSIEGPVGLIGLETLDTRKLVAYVKESD